MSQKLTSSAHPKNRIVVAAIAFAAVLITLTVWLWPRAEAITQVTAADGTKIVLKQPPDDLRKKAHERMMKQVSGYFALPNGERDAYLDKAIDEQLAAMKRLGVDAESLTKDGGGLRMRGPATRPAGDAAPRTSVRLEGSSAERSLTQDLSAEDQARMAEFSRAMMDRRKARGIEEPMVIIHTPSN